MVPPMAMFANETRINSGIIRPLLSPFAKNTVLAARRLAHGPAGHRRPGLNLWNRQTMAIFRQPSMTGELVTLRHGKYSLVVAPGFGARIVSYRQGSRDLLRPTPDEAIRQPKVYEFAGFPLMPYSGPLFGPGFAFQGISYVLDRTVREEPTATHGDAWIAPFDIRQQTEDYLALAVLHVPEPGTFPFRWLGFVSYGLSSGGLTIALRVTSQDHRPMPAGIGFHPYFPKYSGTRLRFEAVGVWQIGRAHV